MDTELTDKQKVAALFTELGIGFDEDEDTITLESNQEKVEGYGGFYAIFDFTEDGSFIDVGIWE